MNPYEHAGQARYLLSVVSHPLAASNRQLLSEILWGAATQMVKSVAKAHNLRNNSHRALFRAVSRIDTRLAPNQGLMLDFNSAEELHVNFYDGDMGDVEFEERRDATIRFVAKMQRIPATP